MVCYVDRDIQYDKAKECVQRLESDTNFPTGTVKCSVSYIVTE